MLISLQSELKKRIRLSLIIDLANASIGSSECRDSTNNLLLLQDTKRYLTQPNKEVLSHLVVNKFDI